MMMKMQTLFAVPAAGGWDHYHTLYQTKLSSDLMSLAGSVRSATPSTGTPICSFQACWRSPP